MIAFVLFCFVFSLNFVSCFQSQCRNECSLIKCKCFCLEKSQFWLRTMENYVYLHFRVIWRFQEEEEEERKRKQRNSNRLFDASLNSIVVITLHFQNTSTKSTNTMMRLVLNLCLSPPIVFFFDDLKSKQCGAGATAMAHTREQIDRTQEIWGHHTHTWTNF